MKSPLFLAGVFLASTVHVFAQQGLAQVESIKFKNLDDDWVQMEVQVGAERNTLPQARNERFVDDIKVTAYFAYELGERKFAFYTASVEIISLEQGDSKNVYFFMPGVVVERDRLPKTPDYYWVSLEVNGQTQPVSNEAFSSGSLSRDLLTRLKEEADKQAGVNKFTLMPHYNAPVGLIRADMSDLATVRIREPE